MLLWWKLLDCLLCFRLFQLLNFSNSRKRDSNEEQRIDMQIFNHVRHKIEENPLCTRETELSYAIDFCRSMLRENVINGRAKLAQAHLDDLMSKLIACNLELDRLKEESNNPSKRMKWQSAIGYRDHVLTLQSARGRNPYCEICLTTIWRVVQRYRQCEECGMRMHEKCIDDIVRDCVAAKLKHHQFEISFGICREQKLCDQDYKCAECERELKFGCTYVEEPRLCDYDGYYYCIRCHWNDQCIIPARVVQNWDFREYKNARKLCILQYLHRYQHFVDNFDMYSMSDLRGLKENRIIHEIEQIVKVFSLHISRNCEICRGNGFYCEICSNDELIFPFSDEVSVCQHCCATFHTACFNRRSKHCPRCARRQSRILLIDEEESVN